MAVKNEVTQQRHAAAQEQLPLISISVKELCTERQRFEVPADYQRQEVWSLIRNQAFIDTILRGDPTFPLEGYNSFDAFGNTLWEMNDGHQRITCLLRFRDGKFKTWTARQKDNAEPNSEPPVEPGRKFDDLPAPAKNYFLNYRLYINCPRQRTDQAKTTRFLRLGNQTPLASAEKLNAHRSRTKVAAKRIAAHPFWEESYDGDTKRMQVLQSSFFLLALELASPKITADVASERYIYGLACGKQDDEITDHLIDTIEDRLDKISCLYDGVHFTRRSIIIPMYQSIRYLEDAGRVLRTDDKGKLTSWIMNIANASKRSSSTPNYALPIQQILREQAQELFWEKNLRTVMALMGVGVMV